ncbi:MAG: agmatinase [Acidobacteria bacterium]|nr:MAG: agmatinase [Acidobacteriota bacterium]
MMMIDRASLPFAGCFTLDPERRRRGRLVFVGLPSDGQSSYRRGCAAGPERVRRAYDGRSYHATTELGVNLAGQIVDLGDWAPQGTWAETKESYRHRAAALFRAGRIPFFVGGDHAVTVPIVEALAVLGQPVHLVQIDAHPDLYPQFDGDPYSHACVAARFLEMEHIASVTQIGIRTLNHVQAEQAARFASRLEIQRARDCHGSLRHPQHLQQEALVYMTIDLDGFDPAFAPGVSHPVPGGLTSRQVLDFIQGARWKLVGMDVVELNPDLDVRDQTAILAARLLHEGMGYAVAHDDQRS